MSKKVPIFYSALLLTAVNLLLRFAGTAFQVFLSGRIGAEGIGLLQLVLSVSSMSFVAAMGGIRTATMYLSAEERGRNHPENYKWVLSGSIVYSIVFSISVALLVYFLAPVIAGNWIGNTQTEDAIRLVATFLPVNCLCGVMVGFFTGINRIQTLAIVEVIEQIFSICTTLLLLHFWAGSDAGKACISVLLGSGLGACLTLTLLVILRLRDGKIHGNKIPIAKRLLQAGLPLAAADNLRTGISTVENLMVPKRLGKFSGSVSPLGEFGTVCGMVFPILTFPMSLLFGLTELLIPELARCNAADSRVRIGYLVQKSLRIALLFGTLCAGILYLCAVPLCMKLYGSESAGMYLMWFAPLAIMLYCDAITDAMIKGLGQQKISVAFNIVTNILDVVFLYLLLPKYGIKGYFISFLITHALNFGLSLRHLLKITGEKLPVNTIIMTVFSAIVSVVLCQFTSGGVMRGIAYSLSLSCLLYLFGVVRAEDFRWLLGLIHAKKKPGRNPARQRSSL